MTPHCLWECPANLLGVIPTRKAQGCPALLPRSLWKQGKTRAVTLTGVISHFIQQMDWCGKRLHLSFWASLSFSSSSPAFSRWDLQIAEAELHPIGAGAKSPPQTPPSFVLFMNKCLKLPRGLQATGTLPARAAAHGESLCCE